MASNTLAPFIENISLTDVRQGWHYDTYPLGRLISITDKNFEGTVKPKMVFSKIHRFVFDDEEDPHHLTHQVITPEQGKEIAIALLNARYDNRSVIVHCLAGLCRSGAVVEVAISRLGFRDTEKHRQPNVLVKKRINDYLDEIGFTTYSDEWAENNKDYFA